MAGSASALLARRLAPRLPQSVPAIAAQRRWWWWDPDATRKAHDKPAITGSKHIFIRGQVPVVMLKTVRGIGQKGQIVTVKRGYARHHLVPKGLAAFGTWENIDAFADPTLVEDPALKARVAAERGRLPFDWVGEIKLRFSRWAREDHLSYLHEPVTGWDILAELSANYELDLLPTSISMPEGGLAQVGLHEVPVHIAFRNPESVPGRYSLWVEVVSLQSQQEDVRREEMAKAVADSLRFQLPERGGAVGRGGLDEDSDEEEEAPADSRRAAGA